jgi:pimeloyl-ACP methyl ester carboxylesterase
MNRFDSIGIATALSFWVAYAVAENPQAPQPSADLSLTVYAKPQQLVELRDGRRIHLFCLGKGSPTVVLTAGLGDWAAAWSKVQAPIALKTRVCAWDRAGFGFSDPSSAPQDVGHTTTDLEEALKRAKIDGPYVLVGHSMGGYESLLFADRHPRQVLGMVFIDPAIPDQDRRARLVAPKYAAFLNEGDPTASLKKCAAELRSGVLRIGSPDPDKCFDYSPSFPPELTAALMRLDSNPARLMTEASTYEQFARSSQIVVNPDRNYGSIPIRVLTASEPRPGTPADVLAARPPYQAEKLRAHAAMAALSTDGITKMVGTSHSEILDLKPEVVISTVGEVIDKARTNLRTGVSQPATKFRLAEI